MGARLTGFVKAVVVWGLIIAATTMAGATGSLVAAPSAGASSPPAPGTLAVVLSGGQSSVHGNPIGIAFDGAGNLYVVENSTNEVVRIASNGTRTVIAGTGQAGAPTPGPATSSNLNNPFAVAVDASGDIFISDSSNNVIEKVTPDGTLSIVAGTGQQGTPVPGPATSSNLFTPQGIAVDTSGNLYIVDHYNQVIEKVTPDGTLSIVAGTGQRGTPVPGPATSSNLHDPEGLAVDAAGNLFIADSGNQMIEKVTPDGTLSIIAGSGAFDAPTPGPATSSGFKYPYGVTPDSSGNVYIADFINCVVEKVSPDGTLSVVAGTGRLGATTPGPATSSDLNLPIDVAVSPSGTLYISDYNNVQIDTVMARVTSVAISNLPASASSGGSFTPTVVTTGDGATSVTSSTTSVCTVDPTSGLVSYVGAGTCTLVAHVAAGTTYASADGADQSFDVAAVAPTSPGTPVLTDNHGSIGLSWAAPSSDGGATVTYTVQASVNHAAFADVATGVTSTSYAYQGSTGGTTYAFRVKATNSAGSSAYSSYSWIQAHSVAPSAPSTPSLTDNHGSIGLTWTAPSSLGGAASVTYTVQEATNGGAFSTVATGLTSASCTYQGSTGGSTYAFQVKATNAAGSSAYSAFSWIQARSVAPGVPSTPVLTDNHGSITVTWSAPSSLGGAASVTYTVQVATNGGAFSTVATGLTSATCTYNSTTAYTTYAFKVKATNAAGSSSYSAFSWVQAKP